MIYQIVGTFEGETEVLDETHDREEAEYLKGEYMMAFGGAWNIRVQKVKVG